MCVYVYVYVYVSMHLLSPALGWHGGWLAHSCPMAAQTRWPHKHAVQWPRKRAGWGACLFVGCNEKQAAARAHCSLLAHNL